MMTWEQFDARLKHIEEQTSAKQERVDGYRDQRMARLFLDSERSQEELAEHLGKERRWVGYHLLFGRFLTFFGTTGSEEGFKLPSNLTERGFRTLWEATTSDGNYSGHKAHTEAAVADERRRFGEVVEALKGLGLPRSKKQVQKAIVSNFGGRSAWMTIEEMTAVLSRKSEQDWQSEDVARCLRTWQATPKVPYRVEKCGEGSDAKYRVVKVKGQVPSRNQLAELSHDLVPMLDDLIREAQKSRVEISLSSLCALASKIKKVVESVIAHIPEKSDPDQGIAGRPGGHVGAN